MSMKSLLLAGLAVFGLGLAATTAQAAPAGGLIATVDRDGDRSGQVEKVTWYGRDYYRPDYRYRYRYGRGYGRGFYGRDFYGRGFYRRDFYGRGFYGRGYR